MQSDAPQCPGAVAPDRFGWFETPGARLRAYEWGDAGAPPILMAHGFFDHGRGFDLLAPYLAKDYRVVAFDARGHGESSRCATYSWMMDVHDALHILQQLGPDTHLIGHSKGGGQLTEAAIYAGREMGKLVNLDGFGPPDDGFFQRPGQPDFSEASVPDRCRFYLDQRRRAEEKLDWPAYPSLDELVDRRARQNPRLDKTWLRYFVYHGAVESEDGWRWKGDRMLTGGGFGPFRADWIAPVWANLETTMLALTGSIEDNWGPLPDAMLLPRLAHVPRLEHRVVEGSGHFLQMEQPALVGRLILDFLGSA
jgi:pimeloyl-ACP methyl ester carboxylesterase